MSILNYQLIISITLKNLLYVLILFSGEPLIFSKIKFKSTNFKAFSKFEHDDS